MASIDSKNDSSTRGFDQQIAPTESLSSTSIGGDSTPVQGRIENQIATTNEVQAGTLPQLTIDGANSKNTSTPRGIMPVIKDLGEGALNEITQHPVQVAESAAIGVAIGAGLALAGPEIAIGAAAVGAAYAGYELFEHAGQWISDGKTVANQKDYSPDQVAQADKDLQNVGAGGVIVGAGMAGAMTGNLLAGSLVGSLVSASNAPVAAAEAPVTQSALVPLEGATPAATKAMTLANVPGDVPRPPIPPAASPPGDAQPAAATAVTNPPGDNPATPAPPAASPPGDAQPAAATAVTNPPGDNPATPAPAEASRPGDAPPAAAVKPFSLGDTTITLGATSEWAETVNESGDTKYGAAVLDFTNRWGTLMEQRMASGQGLSQNMIQATSHEANTNGDLSGSIVKLSQSLLERDWKYGPNLYAQTHPAFAPLTTYDRQQ